MDPQSAAKTGQASSSPLESMMHRRKFLLFTGTAAATAALIGVSCKKDDDDNNNTTPAVNLGTGDVGILNYAYALEQLEAAFYIKVMQAPYGGITAAESEYLADIRDHEIAHRDFFKAALGSNAIQNLEVNFDSIDFTSRASVLGTAKAFEDLGVSAYNGAGRLLQSSDFLTLAGKIVSVEARHAALIRDLLQNGSFADLPSLQPLGAVPANGLDAARTPTQVLEIAKNYLRTPLNASNLPS
ncbi:ferritin-like domain-containing protein [Flaviaesturariibacter amylovorans]|uniref:Ferritin-like domain-containing protein n=1 Tax=Flaviaesturariibacter amylovorans TaxID=1084520 RepID=A0ABP8G3W0_9BACT